MIRTGVHLYVLLYVSIHVTCQKSLNGTLAADLHFQTLVVDFSSNLQTSSATVCSSNAFLIE